MIDQIRKFTHAQPFERFAIELSSGTLLFVDTPDHIALSGNGNGRIAILADDGTFDVISALHITRVRKLTIEEEIKYLKNRSLTCPSSPCSNEAA